MKTRFNFVSETGDGAGFAARLVADGEAVRMYIHDAKAKSVMDNIVPKVGDLYDLLLDADRDRDIFVFDVSGNGHVADYFQSLGFPVIGGSVLHDRLERDRTFGAQIMKDVGIKVPYTKSFTDFEEAKQFVEENPETRWVYKPSKTLGDLSPSHVSYDAEDLLEMLDSIAADVDIAEPQFELQAFEPGVALSTELWFQDGDFVAPLTNHTLERKELMNDDLGPSGGCLGNLTWFCQGCKACNVAKRVIPWAKGVSYHGNIDLNTIVSESGQLFGLEWTPRFGYDATPTLLGELVKGDLGQFFADAARRQFSLLDCRDDFAAALRVTQSPWPAEKYTAEEDVPIRGIEKDTLRDHTYLYNVKENDNGLCTAGAWGITCLFTGRSSNPTRAFNKPMDVARELRLKGKQYRTDLAKRFAEDIEKLESAGVEINVVQEVA